MPTERSAKQLSEFLQIFARAILYWGQVEMNLYLIFQTLMVSRKKEVISAVYHSVINTNARLSMIREAAEIMISDPLLSELKALLKRTDRRVAKRNELAHFLAAARTDADKETTLVLKPSIFDVRKAATKEYDIKQIAEIYESFRTLSVDLDAFYVKLASHIQRSFP